MKIDEKITQLEKDLAKITWEKQEESFNALSKEASILKNEITEKKKAASEIQIQLGKLREVKTMLEDE